MSWIRDPRALHGYRHVVLSPHIDDAALSLGGTIAALTSRGETVLVVTVCGGLPSPFARFSTLGVQLAAHAAPTPYGYVSIRRREEARALAHLGADHYFATTLDAIDRIPARMHAMRDLFSAPPRGDPAPREVRALMFWLSAAAPWARVWAPLAIGGHVDHRIVFAAASAMIPSERLTFYEDFPYALKASARRARLSELRALEAEIHHVGRHLDAHLAAIGEYRSQLSGLFGGQRAMARAVRGQAGTPAIARFWRWRVPRLAPSHRTPIQGG